MPALAATTSAPARAESSLLHDRFPADLGSTRFGAHYERLSARLFVRLLQTLYDGAILLVNHPAVELPHPFGEAH